jgi:hypothetical protein
MNVKNKDYSPAAVLRYFKLNSVEDLFEDEPIQVPLNSIRQDPIRNRIVALTRRKNATNPGLRVLVEEIFFPIEYWPTYVLKVLVLSELNNK